MKPFAESCEQNKDVILKQLARLLKDSFSVLEIGSGTGQHAVHFAKHLAHLTWQCSDQAEYIEGVELWLDEAQLPNTPPPFLLNVSEDDWPEDSYDAIFSANVVHIMSWQNVVDLFKHLPNVLNDNGLLILYGPFNYGGQYTSDSNAQFDVWLKQRDPKSGIRDFEALDQLANLAGLKQKEDIEMPVNNRILCWQKIE